jgi:hypothetical protein
MQGTSRQYLEALGFEMVLNTLLKLIWHRMISTLMFGSLSQSAQFLAWTLCMLTLTLTTSKGLFFRIENILANVILHASKPGSRLYGSAPELSLFLRVSPAIVSQ